MKEMPEEKTTSQVLSKQTPSRQEESEHYSSPTDVIVGLPLEQTGLIAARRGFDARGEQTEIRLVDIQREICSGAQLYLRLPLIVL